MNTTNAKLPELPEGFVLYGQGPLKVPSANASDDIIFWDPSWGTYGWDRSGYHGTTDFGYYALRVGSDVAKANFTVESSTKGVSTDAQDALFGAACGVADTAYKQLEAEFIQQRTELADARNRIVDLERERDGLGIEVNRAKDEASRQFNKVQNLEAEIKRVRHAFEMLELERDTSCHALKGQLEASRTLCKQRTAQRDELAGEARDHYTETTTLQRQLVAEATGRDTERMEALKFLWKVNGALGISGTGSCPSETLARAEELFNKEQTLERQLVAEATDAAQRIIALQDECGRLTELWHGAEGRLALMAEARNNALASAQWWETACREKANKYELQQVDLFAYWNLVTKLAEVLGMSTMEIPLNEVVECVKELAAKLDTFRSNSKLARLHGEAQAACNAWQETAAQHLRNEQFYRDLLGQCAKMLGDGCRRQDDGGMVPEDDFLALRVPEVLREKLASAEMLTTDYNRRTELGLNLFSTAAPFEGALTVGQDVVLDGMKWMAERIMELEGKDSFEFPQGNWSVSISDGLCAFNYVFTGDARKDTCVDDLVALLASFLKGDATLVSRELL